MYRIKLLYWVLTALILLVVSEGRVAGNETLRVVLHEIPPMASQKYPNGGFYCQVAREIFAQNKIDISVKWYPMKRAFVLLERGEADLAIGWSKVPGREAVFTYSDKPLATASILFFYRKDSPFDWKTIEDLKGLTIGDRIGSKAGGKSYLAAEKSGDMYIERVTDEAQNVKKLLSGRIDIMIGDSISMPAILQKEFSDQERRQIIAHPKPLRVIEGYAIFNKKVSQHIVDIFDNGMKQLRENGRYKELYDKAIMSGGNF